MLRIFISPFKIRSSGILCKPQRKSNRNDTNIIELNSMVEMNDRRQFNLRCGDVEPDGQLKVKTKTLLFVLLSVLGFIVYNLAGYNPFFGGDLLLVVRFIVPISLLILTLLSANLIQKPYRCILISFFGISLGFLLAAFLGKWHLLLGYTTSTIEGLSIAKLAEVLPILLAVLLVTFLTGNSLKDILYIGGKIPKSLVLGLLVIPLAIIQYLAMGGLSVNVGLETIVSWTPWLLLFGFSNGLMEETIFRGLLFRKYEPLMGSRISLIQTSLIFAIFHISLLPFTDLSTMAIFLVFLFLQGLAWCWVVQKSDSIWGGVLAHAIADILFVIVVFGII